MKILEELIITIRNRKNSLPKKSYTKKLLDNKKLAQEKNLDISVCVVEYSVHVCMICVCDMHRACAQCDMCVLLVISASNDVI